MQIEFRPMQTSDLDRVCELEERSFSMPWKKEDFAEMIERDNSTYFVAVCDGLVIGTAGYTFNGFEGYINNVVIDEKFRGNGFAKGLMEALLEEGRAKNISEFTLEVRVGNDSAIRLYKGLGFENEGVRKNFYERPTEDAYVMWLRY